MQLRKHPKFMRQWPPLLGGSINYGSTTHIQRREIGILRAVELRPAQEEMAPSLVLIIEHDGQHRKSQLNLATDDDFCDHLHQILAACIGQSIQEIGSQEIGFYAKNSWPDLAQARLEELEKKGILPKVKW